MCFSRVVQPALRQARNTLAAIGRAIAVKRKSKKFNLMLTGKNKGRFRPHKLSKDLLKNKFFTSESLVKLVQSYRKKTRKSTFFSYHYVNIRLNFLLLQRIIQLPQSEIGAIESVVFTALTFSSDCASRPRRLQLTGNLTKRREKLLV